MTVQWKRSIFLGAGNMRHALLLDGGFVIKKLQSTNHLFPSADEILTVSRCRVRQCRAVTIKQVCPVTLAEVNDALG